MEDDEEVIVNEGSIGVDDDSSELDQLQNDGENSQEEQTVEEAIFEINGEKTPYSKLTPDQVQNWYKDSINRAKWQSENTRKAQEIAEQRREYEDWKNNNPNSERDLAEYKAVINLANNNPELAEHIRRVYEQSQGRGMQGIKAQQSINPEFEELKQKFQSLEQERLEEREERERNEALRSIIENNKDIDKEDFQNFVNEVTEKNDIKSLYGILHSAYQGRNIEDMRKRIEKEVVDRIKKNRTLDVNTGGNTTQVNMSENSDISQSYEDMFDELGSSLGI